MAKECIKTCPRIRGILDSIGTRNLFSSTLPIHPDFFMGLTPTDYFPLVKTHINVRDPKNN